MPVSKTKASAKKTTAKSHVTRKMKRKICYVFQGGGALGMYQVGAYEAFREYD